MSAFRPVIALLLVAGCAPEWVDPEGSDLDPLERVTCDPLMNHFPVGDAHNIGYDHSSCGTGTCDISCPDANANSDWGGAHHGIDIFAYQGAPLVAVTDAEVVAVGVVSSTSGLRVRLRDACGWEYYYGHMDTAVVSVGQSVAAGQLIGTMGYTGTSSTHLHFNVSPDGDYYDDIDPIDLLVATSATACGAAPVDPHDDDDCDDDEEAPPSTTPNPQPTGDCGVFEGTTILEPYDSLWSCDGRFQLAMQGDGNLVLYKDRTRRRCGTPTPTARRATGPPSRTTATSSSTAPGTPPSGPARPTATPARPSPCRTTATSSCTRAAAGRCGTPAPAATEAGPPHRAARPHGPIVRP